MIGPSILAGGAPPSTPRPWVPEVPEVPAVVASGSVNGNGITSIPADGHNVEVPRLNADGSVTQCVLYLNVGATFTPPADTATTAWVLIDPNAGDNTFVDALTTAGFANVVRNAGTGTVTCDQPHAGGAGNVAISTVHEYGTGSLIDDGLVVTGMSGGVNLVPAVAAHFGPPGPAGTIAGNLVEGLHGVASAGPITCPLAHVDDLITMRGNTGGLIASRGVLENTVSVAGQIQQLLDNDLSAAVFDVLLQPYVERH